jgi:4'-phosphopantetheinyl transferase
MRVGVDVECERPRDVTRIARFAFTEEEYAQLESLATESERVERFYVLWTLKEAFAKALSLPLLGSLRQCAFFEVGGGEWRGSVPTTSAWVARTFRASATLVLSVVAVLPERVSPADFRVSACEWPAIAAASWRALAALRSDG